MEAGAEGDYIHPFRCLGAPCFCARTTFVCVAVCAGVIGGRSAGNAVRTLGDTTDPRRDKHAKALLERVARPPNDDAMLTPAALLETTAACATCVSDVFAQVVC